MSRRTCWRSGPDATRSSARSGAWPGWAWMWPPCATRCRRWWRPPPRRRWRCRRRIRPAPSKVSSGRGRPSRWATARRLGAGSVAELTYLQAVSDGLREAMRRDDRVLCLGEDVGAFGGAFKVTDGFVDEFGEDRVMDTPLAEAGIIGTAIGAAVVGLRPVCEMQFADFVACGFDQLVNVAGKMHYRQGLAVPITVRLPSGGGFSGGPFHSQNPEAWFMHAPGLKVVAPSTAEDAHWLLVAAIRDPNPVVFLEHKHLYRRVTGEIPNEPAS